jgi:hypothetical protein
MADNDIPAADINEHQRRDFTGVCPFFLIEHILRREYNISIFSFSAAADREVKGGAMTILTSETSFTAGTNADMNSPVSRTVLFIFQFAAIKGFRIVIL